MDLTRKKHQNIRDDFAKLDSTKYTLNYRLQMLSEKYFLAPDTIYLIVTQAGSYRPKNKA
jgi:hypothetical protein